MHEAPIKDSDSATGKNNLTEPHFDDLAVLIAQPVEPLATEKRDWFAVLEKPRMMIAALVVAALLGTTALALTLQMRREPRVEGADVTESKPEETNAEIEGPIGNKLEPPAAAPRKTRRPTVRVPVTSDGKQPVARRVGVIHYGSSSDRP